MKSKKGFTLVELLAVIAILAILILIALPNIMSLFNNAKKESFTNEIKEIVKTAEQQWMNDSMFDTQEIVYSRVTSEECPKSLKLSGRSQLNYYIKVNKAGKIVEYYAEDGTYQYSYNGQGLKIEEIDGVLQISNINDNQKISISCGGVSGGSGSSGGSSATNIATCVNSGCTKTAKETELVIGGENFYVVSSNETETVPSA